MSENIPTIKTRNYNLDLIRILACFMVIMVHVRLNYTYDASGSMHLFSSFYLTAIRPCVPLFILLSGLLLLPTKDTLPTFLKRRFSRVFIPMVVWVIFYALMVYPFSLHGWSPVYEFTPAENAPLLTRALYNIAISPITFTGETCHFWFLYIILGLYLFIPIISPWIEKASAKTLLFFLSIWGVTLCFPYLQHWGISQFLGMCDWNLQYNMFTYFSGYLGFLVLGYYLFHYNPLSAMKSFLLGLTLFIIGWGITWGLVYQFAMLKTETVMLELVIGNLTPNVVLMTAGVFLMLQKIMIREKLKPILAYLSNLSYGIFLVHWIIAVWLTHIFDQWQKSNGWDIPASIGMPILSTTVFIISLGIVAVINKLPCKKWIIG